MAEIALIPVDAPEPPAEPDSPSASSAMLPEEALPAKRGRGRPPGAKNKAKSESDPEPPPVITLTPVTAPTAAPKKRKAPPPPEEEESEEETPPPRQPRRRQKTEIACEPDPISSHSQRLRLYVETQTRRRDTHAERIYFFPTMLDKMVAY